MEVGAELTTFLTMSYIIVVNPQILAAGGRAGLAALLYVACSMLGAVRNIAWDDATEALPAAVTALGIAFPFSIAPGIAPGFIA